MRNALQVLQTSLAHTFNGFPAAQKYTGGVDPSSHMSYLETLIPAITRMNPGASIVIPGGTTTRNPKPLTINPKP